MGSFACRPSRFEPTVVELTLASTGALMPLVAMDADGLPPPPSPGEPGPEALARDRAPIVAIAVALLLGLAAVAGLVVLLVDKEPPADLSLQPAAGTSSTYRLRASDDVNPSEAFPDGGHMDLSTTVAITVSAVDARITTTEVHVNGVVARFNGGEAAPVAVAEPQVLRLDEQARPDGVVMVAADGTGSFFYFVDVLVPVVPREPASEGDSWPVSFEASVPTATGVATYEGRGELVGYENVAGANAAEVRNELSFEYDFTVAAREVAELSGLGSVSSGTIRLTGTGSMTLTGWIDPATGRVLRAEVEGTYDVVWGYRDFDQTETDIADADVASTGEFATMLELLPAH